MQLKTQTPGYWGSSFALTESDIQQIGNHFLEVERPQTVNQLAHVIIAHRVAEEKSKVERLLSGRTIYQPKSSYDVGDDLVFPRLQFAHGEVTTIRDGYNPQHGKFKVIAVEIDNKKREFAADLTAEHALNVDNGDAITKLVEVDLDSLYALYQDTVAEKIAQDLEKQEDFVRLGDQWFVKALMAEVNIGHLHLAEAVLEMNEGGPMPTTEMIPQLDMNPDVDIEVKEFSLNYHLLQDDRFDEVAPKGKSAWFLRRLEPDEVSEVPKRLQYTPIPYDEALLSPQLLLLERELDDEWSSLEPIGAAQPVVFTLTYPHRLSGTMPLSSRIRPLLPLGHSPRQRIVFIDEFTNEEIVGWVVLEHRYIYGLKEWYEENGIPIGGFLHLKSSPDSETIILGYDRRRAQREWVRLATAADNRINFELSRRSIGCGYDDLLIVGTDVVAAIDALWRRAEANQRSVASLLAEIFPPLSELAPQKTVHAKTLYSAINMLRRVPPGPLFAELVRHPAFQPVGDHYWRFDSARWREGH